MIVILYHFAVCICGIFLLRKFFYHNQDFLLSTVISVVLGIGISLPLTYLIAVLLRNTVDPIQHSALLFSFGVTLFLWKKRKSVVIRYPISLTKKEIIDIVVVFVCLIFSTYIMGKSFKLTSDNAISVSRNTVFDFGHNVSILRSMSWGDNIPYSSPFVAKTEHIYHFMFQFWSAIIEHAGLPIDMAVNIPSIVVFTLFLLVIYLFGKDIFKSVYVGILGILFTMFHSGLMFIPYIQQRGFSLSSLLNNPNYLFFGPFDGSTFSLFFTLNVFVNQRHLGFALAFFFIIYRLFHEDLILKKLTLMRVLIYAVFVGFFTLWHLVLAVGLLSVLVFTLFIHRKWKEIFVLVSNALFVSFIFIHQWVPSITRAIWSLLTSVEEPQPHTASMGDSVYVFFLKYIFLNFGMMLVFIFGGMFREKKARSFFAPLLILMGLLTLISSKVGAVDQKYLNVLLVICGLFASSGVIAVWKKGMIGKILMLLVFPILIVSGIIDFMVIKNDFMFPLTETANGKLVSWIDKGTPKNSIFISYQDIFDPVTLSGRKNYYGFYKEPPILLENSDKHRDEIVQRIFEAKNEITLKAELTQTNANYLIIPLWDKPDFFYNVDISLFRNTFPIAYEDAQHLILQIQ